MRPRICSEYCGGTIRGIILNTRLRGIVSPDVDIAVTENPPWTWRWRPSWAKVLCPLHERPFYVHVAYTLGPLPREEDTGA